MSVYTRIGRRSGVGVPFWVLPFLLPLLLLWLAVVGLFWAVRLSWMALSLLWYGGVSLLRWTRSREEDGGEV